MRAAFEKWFVKYKVDLVFAGHVHAYERSVSSSIQHSVLHWNFRAVDMLSMVRISWICSFGVELGIWMLISHGYRIIYLQYRISNVNYNITSGNRYPVPDKSAPVYITVGDGGNQEGLASRWEEIARKLINGTISFIELLHPSGLVATRFVVFRPWFELSSPCSPQHRRYTVPPVHYCFFLFFSKLLWGLPDELTHHDAGLTTPSRTTLHSGRPVTAIQFYNWKTGLMPSTGGIEMTMGITFQQTPWCFITNTGERPANCFYLGQLLFEL